jgi:uncharacterized protein (DUF433 family)
MAIAYELLQPQSYPHIDLDANGRACIAGSRMRVSQIIANRLSGLTTEQIVESFPPLSFAEVHSALAYYYDHKEAVDSELQREAEFVAKMRASGTQPSRSDLEARRSTRGDQSG